MSARRRVAAALLGGVVAALAGPPEAHAQRLGRLFTSPEQRATLDELRYQAQFTRPAPEPEAQPAVAAAQPEPQAEGPMISRLTVNGVVRQSGGRGSVWVNGDEVRRGSVTREGIQVDPAGIGGRNVRVRLPSGVESVELKPGQQIDVQSGAVLEPYERARGADAAPTGFESPESEARRPPAGEAPADASGEAAPAPAPAPAREALAQRLRANAALPPSEQPRALEELRRELGPDAGAEGTTSPR